jgi:hypothetical protein
LWIFSGVSWATFSIFDAALGGGDDDRARGGAVEEDGEVVLLLDALASVK